jgi:putative tryptophan/tyrosine transport system substrate-binding protein
MMQRREFITLLLGAAAAWPLAAWAQQAALPVIGFLGRESPALFAARLEAFRGGLAEAGYTEGRNVAIEYRWANGEDGRLPALVEELVRLGVRVIVAVSGVPPAQAAKAATSNIPIVFTTGSNPVEAGLVASLNRPGGNLTGVTDLGAELGPKRLEIMHELIPAATDFGFLVNPTNPYDLKALPPAMQAAANARGVKLHVLHASTEREFDPVFAGLNELQVRALVVSPDTLFVSRSEQLAAVALRHNIPTILPGRDFPTKGGLVSYGGNVVELAHQVGLYAGRILNGEKPADLPVQEATKIELIINLRAAKALGITVPLSLVYRADEIIE